MKEFVEKLLNELNYQKEYNQIVYDAKPRTEHEKDLNAVLQSTYDSAIRIVKRLAGEYERENLTGWVPCSERLPEENQTVMLTFKNSAGLHVGEATYKNNMFFYITDTEFGYYEEVYKNPIAWRSLPAPYQPKGE